MVIQRWQSVLLLLATVLMAVATFFSPIAESVNPDGTPAPMFMTDAPILAIVSLLVAALLCINIFMYKNLKRQMQLTLLSIVLICVVAVTGAFILYRNAMLGGIIWSGAVLLLIIAAVLAMAAYRFMRRDHNLLRSADRLR